MRRHTFSIEAEAVAQASVAEVVHDGVKHLGCKNHCRLEERLLMIVVRGIDTML